MKKSIGIVICNYNKQDYIVNCIHSIFASTTEDFDLYVVDNASTDQSVENIRNAFGNTVNLIINSNNLGGSGGFNTGIREVLKRDYEYLMCVDNDVVFDKNAVASLRYFLEQHPEVGMVGSRTFFMDDPERIWGFGGKIDFEKYLQNDYYKNCLEGEDVPEWIYCDYVPACALMTRVEVVRKVGIMPEENFIYWDDMEWGYRFNEAGYKVAAYGEAKVWHKGGGRNSQNTFIHYYMWRNRINFFLKVLSEQDREHFADTILDEMFRMIYSVNLKGETNIVKTLMYAFDDAVHGVRGVATTGKVLPRFSVENRVQKALEKWESVIIRFNDDYEGIGNIIRNIMKIRPDIKIRISIQNCKTNRERMEYEYPGYQVTEEFSPGTDEFSLFMCSHIFSLTEDDESGNYIDSWCNIIFNEEDLMYAKNFKKAKELFILCMKNLLMGI